jgi:hypothetical protein
MTDAQVVRNIMAEAGVEIIPDEAKKLLFVHNQLVNLSKLSLKELKQMMNPSDINSVMVFETVTKLKRARKNNAKTKEPD